MVNKISFNFEDTKVSRKDIKNIATKALPELNKIRQKGISPSENLNCLNQPFDLSLIEEVKDLSREKKALHPDIIVIVGIGGSNLGTLAVERALIDEYKHHKEGLPNFRYADTIDSTMMYRLTKEIELDLAKGKNVLIIAISKSGTTLESLANFEILINSLKIYKEDYKKYLVTISDSDSLLTNWAKENKISYLTIPSFVGGRYSVFSAVSLFPLSLIGVKIEEIFSGARDMHKLCLDPNININPALISAAVHYYLYTKKKVNISNTFVFGKNLEYLARWYRQLLAESLGKELDLNGKKVNRGITPIVSLGTEDLHSMEQLCISGPYDKITTFVFSKKQNYNLYVPLVSSTGLSKYMQGYDLNEMIHFIIEGVKEAFHAKKRPFLSVELGDISEFSVGQFMMWKMFEVVYLGKLMNVNPFDQPGVESYKKATREFMSKNAPLIE